MSVATKMTVRALREEVGMDVMELAYKAGVSVPTIYRIENGTVPVTRLIAQKVLNVLGKELGRKITLDEVQGILLIKVKK